MSQSGAWILKRSAGAREKIEQWSDGKRAAFHVQRHDTHGPNLNETPRSAKEENSAKPQRLSK